MRASSTLFTFCPGKKSHSDNGCACFLCPSVSPSLRDGQTVAKTPFTSMRSRFGQIATSFRIVCAQAQKPRTYIVISVLGEQRLKGILETIPLQIALFTLLCLDNISNCAPLVLWQNPLTPWFLAPHHAGFCQPIKHEHFIVSYLDRNLSTGLAVFLP